MIGILTMSKSKLTVSSDNYLEFHPAQADLYESFGNRKIRQHMAREIYPLESSISHLEYTYSDIANIVRKTELLAMDTKEGILQKLDELFDSNSNTRYRGPRSPGSIRIYGNGLACYYTGKNWKKINLIKDDSTVLPR